MRKTLLLAFFALLVTMIQAQPILNQSAVGAIGSTFYLGVQDTFPNGFSIGSAGANQSWDMGNLLVNGFDTISFVSPSTSPYAASFPTANMAINQASLDGTAFLQVSGGGLDLLGLAADLLGTGSPIVVQQTPPSRIAQFPFTYQNTFTNTTIIDETVDASSFGIAFVDSARIKKIQERNLEADGYGMLVLPAGSNANVLRVKEINLQTDSIFIHTFLGWSLFQDSVYTDSTFTWWNTTKGYYLAQATYIGGTISAIRYQDPVIVGAPEPTGIAFQVYPNPASDRLFIDTDGKTYDLRISDLQGRVIAQQKLHGTHAEVAVGELQRGFYLYAIIDKNGFAKQSGKVLLTR
jgi:Secretion system C-terminal sorting domain